MTKGTHKLTATKLRLLLIIGLVLIFALSVAGFIFLRGKIAVYSTEVNTIAAEAQASESKVRDLEQTKKKLEEYADARERATKIVAESKSYQYQDEIVRDITTYANQAGVSVTGFTFNNSGETSGAATATPAAPATDSATPATETTTPTATGTSSLKSTTVVVSLDTDIQYNNLLKFMSLLEQNLTKMQTADVNLSKSAEKGPDIVSVQALSLEVYIR